MSGTPESRRIGGPGFDVLELARTEMVRHRMLSGEPDVIVVAVSGGPDSMCLLDVLARLSGVFHLRLEIAHVDHGLRDGSDEVAAAVSSHGASAGFDVHVIRAPDLAGPNVQARARDFRYAFFRTIAQDVGATRIALGHTLDDRVETTVARLIHGAGTVGLAGLRPVEGDRIRPLVAVRRAETRSYCEKVGLPFFDDPSNDDERFERARIRNIVVTAIEDDWGDGAVRAMATSSARLAEDADLIAQLSDALYVQLAKGDEGSVTFDRAAFDGVPRGMRRRLLERGIGRVRDRAAAIDEVLDALDGDELKVPARFAVAGGSEIVVDGGAVTVIRSVDSGR